MVVVLVTIPFLGRRKNQVWTKLTEARGPRVSTDTQGDSREKADVLLVKGRLPSGHVTGGTEMALGVATNQAAFHAHGEKAGTTS